MLSDPWPEMLPTTLALTLLATALLLPHRSTRRFTSAVELVRSRGPGGTLVRRLGIVAILAPPLLGALTYGLLRFTGVVDVALAIAVLTTVAVPVALCLIFVTGRKVEQAHDALAVSREQARALIEESADAFFLADVEGRYTDVNAAGCRMLGYASADEIIGKTILDLIPPDEVERLADSRTGLLGGSTQTAEWHLRRRDGSYLPVEVSARILPDGRWQGVVRDITKRKEAEASARRSEARLEGIISLAADAIISVDEQQRIVLYNDGATRIFGWSPAEIIGQPLDVLIPGRFAEVHRHHMQAFDREQAAARMMQGRPTIAGLRRNGEEFPAEAAISKFTVDGHPLYNVFLRDVTVTRQLQQDLRQALERFRLLAEAGEILGSSLETEAILRKLAALGVRSFAAGVFIELSNGDGTLSRAWAESSQGAGEDAVQIERRVLDPKQPPEWLTAQGGKPWLSSPIDEEWLRGHTLDDRAAALIRHAHVSSVMQVPIVAGDRPVGTMLYVAGGAAGTYAAADLPVALELARRTGLAAENARLYRAARDAILAKDEMLSIVAHDLRSPLAAAQMAASMLALQVPEDRRENSRRTAETIHRSIRLATRLVEDLLDIARIEAGKLALDLKPVAPEVMVHHAVESCLQLAASAGVTLEAEVGVDLEPVLADEDRIQQVFTNLLGNALKFTPAGGRVRVVARRQDRTVRFDVTDTGIGIAADDLSRIFDRFWQARSGDRRGAGLGLAIANGIVVAHGGRIWAESAPGEGSTFSFALPVARLQPDASHATAYAS